MSQPIPLILCGKTTQIGQGVMAGLKPEYEVINFILTPEAGAETIPGLLQGKPPAHSDSPDQIGTQDYSQTAVAVVTGGGYDDAGLQQMRQACGSASKVPWLRPDLEKPTPPLGPEYGKHMVGRVKACLAELQQNGKMQTDGVVYY